MKLIYKINDVVQPAEDIEKLRKKYIGDKLPGNVQATIEGADDWGPIYKLFRAYPEPPVHPLVYALFVFGVVSFGGVIAAFFVDGPACWYVALLSLSGGVFWCAFAYLLQLVIRIHEKLHE